MAGSKKARLVVAKLAAAMSETGGRNVLPAAYREAYKQNKGTCGDEIADLFAAAKVEEVAQANNIDLSRWEGKNAGMVRMNLGNVIRGMIRREERVVIGSRVWEAIPKPEKAPKAPKAAKAAPEAPKVKKVAKKVKAPAPIEPGKSRVVALEEGLGY